MSDPWLRLNFLAILLLGIFASPQRPLAQSLRECGPANEDHGTVRIGCSLVLQSKVLEQERRLNVYVPPDYDDGRASYPTLYLLDGGVHEDFVHIAGIASLAADFRKIRPFIVVGIEGIDRYHDLFPPSKVREDQERLPTAGGSADFRSFLTAEVVPFVQKTLRTTEETVLLGESAAGHFVVETFLREPGAFGGYVAVSPSLWWNGKSLAQESATLLATNPPRERRLFLTIADEGGEMRDAVDVFSRSVSSLGQAAVNLRYEPMEGESHGTILHPAALAAVRWLFATPPATDP